MSAIHRPSDDLVLKCEDVTNAVSADNIETNNQERGTDLRMM